jgi:excisionase family DNA binding protein
MKRYFEPVTLSVAEAAALIGVHPRTAYELAGRGELPIVRFGGRIFVKRKALLDMLGAGEPAVTAARGTPLSTATQPDSTSATD